jgi:hypothetical protein
VLLRNYVPTVTFDLVNDYVDVSSKKPFRRLLDVNIETIHRLVQLVLRLSRFEYFVKLLAEILMVRKVVLNCAF